MISQIHGAKNVAAVLANALESAETYEEVIVIGFRKDSDRPDLWATEMPLTGWTLAQALMQDIVFKAMNEMIHME